MKFVEDALLLRFVTKRRLLFAVVFWATLYYAVIAVPIALVIALLCVVPAFAYLRRPRFDLTLD